MLQRILLLASLSIVTAASGCMGFGGQHTDVKALDDQFQPNSLNAKQNDLVEWHNEGSKAHTVTIHKVGESGTKKDTEIQPSAETTYTFQETGTFHVYCKYHCTGCLTGNYQQGMVMTVTVS